MEVFHGLDADVYDALEDQRIGGYMSRIRTGGPNIVGADNEAFVRTGDGTVTGFRLRGRQRRGRP